MSPAYLSRKDAAVFLGCSLRFLDRVKANGDLPFHRLSRRLITFSISDLQAFADKRRVEIGAGE